VKGLVPLFFAIGTIITQKHIDAAYNEAKEYVIGSKEWKSFMCYAKSLEKRLKKQEELK